MGRTPRMYDRRHEMPARRGHQPVAAGVKPLVAVGQTQHTCTLVQRVSSQRHVMPAQLPDTTTMLETLVKEPSVSCTSAAHDKSNLGVINHLATWLESLAFDVEVVPLPDKPGKANLIAKLNPAGAGIEDGGLVLAGHTDTVPCDESLWRVDPYELTDEGERIYGLGTCDMKGFFPIALGAAAAEPP